MAEIVGLLASITALVAAGFKISKTVAAIAEDFGSAASQIRAISVDTKAVALILSDIKIRLQSIHGVPTEVQDVLYEIVDLCKTDIDDIGIIMMPLLSKNPLRSKLSQMAKWWFVKSKVSLRQASLDSLKLTLNLFLQALGFVVSGDIKEELREHIASLMEKTKNTKTILLDAERTGRVAEAAYQALTQSADEMAVGNDDNGDWAIAGTPPCGVPGDGRSPSADVAEENNTQALTISRHIHPDTNVVLAIDALDNLPLDGRRLQDYIEASDFAVARTISDEQFIHIAEHVRLQRVLNGLALAILEAEPLWNEALEETDHGKSWKFEFRPRQKRKESFAPPPASEMTQGDASPPVSTPLGSTATDHQGFEGIPNSRSPYHQYSHQDTQQPFAQPRAHPESNYQSRFPFDPRLRQGSNYLPRTSFGSAYMRGAPAPSYGPSAKPTPVEPSEWTSDWPFNPYGMSSPSEDEARPPAVPIQEYLEIKEKLARYEMEQAAKVEKEQRKEFEDRIRRESEEAIKRTLQAQHIAQQEAKMEIEKARRQAEEAAKKKFEQDRQEAAEKQRMSAEAAAEAERNARVRFEKEMRAKAEADFKAAAYAEEARQKLEAEMREKFETEMRGKLETELLQKKTGGLRRLLALPKSRSVV